MLKMVYKGKFALRVAIGLKQKTSFMMNTKATGTLPSHPCTIFKQHSCRHCISPGMLWPHLWTTQDPSSFEACSDSSSLWTMHFWGEPQQCQNPALLFPNLYLEPTLQAACLLHLIRRQVPATAPLTVPVTKPEAESSHLATWQCSHWPTQTGLSQWATFNSSTGQPHLIQAFGESMSELSRRVRQAYGQLTNSHPLPGRTPVNLEIWGGSSQSQNTSILKKTILLKNPIEHLTHLIITALKHTVSQYTPYLEY